MTVQVYPTQYTVSGLPERHPDRLTWAFRVEFTGGFDPSNERVWAVRRAGRCLSRAGVLVFEPVPSSRTDAWLAEHRFTLAEALALAIAEAPQIVVNEMTAADVLARTAETVRCLPDGSTVSAWLPGGER